MAIVPKMVTKIDSLEKELQQTKNTYGNAVLTLVERVKFLNAALKRMSKRVVSQSVSTYKRRARSANKGKEIGTCLDFFSAAKERFNSAKVEVNMGRVEVKIQVIKGQREGKAPMTADDVQATQKTKAQIEQEKVELKEKFEKMVRSIESFVPKDSEIEKTRVKRTGIEIQIATSKKQKIAVEDVPITEEKVEVVKKEEPIKKRGKRKKQMGRKDFKNWVDPPKQRHRIKDFSNPFDGNSFAQKLYRGDEMLLKTKS
ncbi:hypothetical protein Tco_1367975 [Tanacetum coccineum]